MTLPPLPRWLAPLADADPVDVATRLTLVLLVLFDWVVGTDWWLKLPIRVLAVSGLLVPGWHRQRTLWALIAAVMSLKTLGQWWTQDNHLFVLTWWCIALALCLRLPDPQQALARNGRMLVGLAFGLATLWKGFLSPDFMSGNYFHYTFLTDPRFLDFTSLLSGIGDAVHQHNREATIALGDPAKDVFVAQLETSRAIATSARLVTWWTVLIEGAIALTFLWPYGRGPSRYRHWTLLVFSASTYMVASVATFAWTLLILGLAQCEPRLRRTRVLYVAILLLVLLYDYANLPALARALLPAWQA